MNEIWKKIADFESYEVSNLGRVRRNVSGKVKLLKGSKNADGYSRIGFYICKKNGIAIYKHKMRYHLVLEAFVGPMPKGMECRHMDGSKTNDRLSNLKWGTHKENISDRTKHGTAVDNRGSKHGMSKLVESQVLEIRNMRLTGAIFSTIASKFSVSPTAVRNIVIRRNWRHV